MLKMPLTGSRDPKSKNIRRDVDDVDSSESFLKQRLLIFIFSGILMAICFVLLIVGIVYLTGNFYPFSFTRFSTTLVAGLFIAFSIVIMAMVVANIYLVVSGRDQLVGLTTVVSVVLLTVLFAIGIWGLSVATGQTFVQTVRQGMSDTIQGYEFNYPDHYSTRKFDWLQRTFNCCGIDSYQDWKGYRPILKSILVNFEINFYLTNIKDSIYTDNLTTLSGISRLDTTLIWSHHQLLASLIHVVSTISPSVGARLINMLKIGPRISRIFSKLIQTHLLL